jgi:hypothetical protein
MSDTIAQDQKEKNIYLSVIDNNDPAYNNYFEHNYLEPRERPKEPENKYTALTLNALSVNNLQQDQKEKDCCLKVVDADPVEFPEKIEYYLKPLEESIESGNNYTNLALNALPVNNHLLRGQKVLSISTEDHSVGENDNDGFKKPDTMPETPESPDIYDRIAEPDNNYDGGLQVFKSPRKCFKSPYVRVCCVVAVLLILAGVGGVAYAIYRTTVSQNQTATTAFNQDVPTSPTTATLGQTITNSLKYTTPMILQNQVTTTINQDIFTSPTTTALGKTTTGLLTTITPTISSEFNLALNMTAMESTIYNIGGQYLPAGLAVDGLLGTVAGNMECAGTLHWCPENAEWFAVDLGNTFSIYYVSLLSRTDYG